MSIRTRTPQTLRTLAPRTLPRSPLIPLCLHASRLQSAAPWLQRPRRKEQNLGQVRWHSAPASKSKVYDFDDIQKFTTNPSPDRILIDVREPNEYNAGYIPTAHNMPINSQPDAIFLPADEFEDRLGFEKPKQEQEVIFYCKSGVRSSAAAKLAEQVGYEKVGEYRGSWLDWTKKGGERAGG